MSAAKKSSTNEFAELMSRARGCRHCAAELPCDPRPVFAASPDSKIVIIGQAPGRRVQESGIAWHDPSGDRLRDWLGIDSATFYDESAVALVPMGFCYPGTGKSGDLPPRPECAPLWHAPILSQMTNVRLTLLIGNYAQRHYLAGQRKKTLTENVRAWKEFGPDRIPLPHPSPRNNIWMKKNPWFQESVLPHLKRRVKQLLS